MVVNITTIHFHYQVVTILGSEVHFNSSDVHYSVFTVYVGRSMGQKMITVTLGQGKVAVIAQAILCILEPFRR